MRKQLIGGVLLCLTVLEAEEIEPRAPHWSFVGDFVYLQRTDLHDVSIVQDSSHPDHPNRTVIHTKDLIHHFDWEPGYRVAATYSPTSRTSVEAILLLVESWEGQKKKQGDESLSFPFKSPDYDQDFTDADKADAQYTCGFWDVELNYWHHFVPRRQEFFGLSGGVGLRFIHWDEHFSLLMTTPPDTSRYTVHTDNRIVAVQVGLDFAINPTPKLHWDLQTKVGGFANGTEQHQFLGDANDVLIVRNSDTQRWQSGMFADVAAQLILQCFSWCDLHAGYQMLFLTGLSLAPEQVSKSVGSTAGKKDYTHGDAIVHGLFTGIRISF